MTVKQIMRLRLKTIIKKCNGNCESTDCLFPQHLWEYREDGFCIKECLQFVDGWINEDKSEIEESESRIQKLEKRIKLYQEFKEKMENELK